MRRTEEMIFNLLREIGENPERQGLAETPHRVAVAFKTWFEGYHKNPADVFKTFEDGSEGYDQMIIVRDIPVYSHCEHHMAPFFGVAHVAYIPNKKILGLSKFSRVVDIFARRLQVQERLTNQIADEIQRHLTPAGVGVQISCRHMCMESRGIQRIGTSTITTALRGLMHSDASAKEEFLNAIRG